MVSNFFAFRTIYWPVLLGVICLNLAACASQEDENKSSSDTSQPIYTVVTEGTLQADTPIPLPTDAPILTVTGRINNPNEGDSIVMDLATLEMVGLVDYTLQDPFEEVETTYRGPLMSDLVALWGVDPEATTLVVSALNDYSAEIPLNDIMKYPVIFALQRDGEYMPIATRGPAMLVFPYDDFEFDSSIYNNYWVWQIKSIEVR